ESSLHDLATDERARHQALHTIYKASANCLRDMDLTTRWLSDGLAMLLPGASATEAMRVARRLQTSIEGLRFEIDGEPVKLSMCLGIAEGIEGYDSYRVLYRGWEALRSARETANASSFIHDGIKIRPCHALAANR